MCINACFDHHFVVNNFTLPFFIYFIALHLSTLVCVYDLSYLGADVLSIYTSYCHYSLCIVVDHHDT